MNTKTRDNKMYKFKSLKDGSTSVYKDGYFCCIIDAAFAINSGYKSSIAYCKNIFK